MGALEKRLKADLTRVVGEQAVVVDEDRLADLATDFVGQRGVPGVAVRPSDGEQVAEVLRLASERGLSVVSRGQGTNLCGGMDPDPGSVLLDLSGMDRVLEVDAEAQRAVVQPGVINAALQERVAQYGLCFSPDPASRDISSIGGNIAENAGGPSCLKYGVTLHHVVGLQVALADGRLLSLTDDDPVDLVGLMIGSEGILGVLTRATLRLRETPPAARTALASFGTLEAAAEAVSAVVAAGLLPAALELCDRRAVELIEDWRSSGYPRHAEAILLADVDGTQDEVAEDAAKLEEVLREFDPDLRASENEREREQMWAGRLGVGHALQATGKRFYICDVTVPRQRLPEMITRARSIASSRGFDAPVVAHAGDGNLHPGLIYDEQDEAEMLATDDEIIEAALELGGTLTGEHGVGTQKVRHMRRRFARAELAAFRAIKNAFDPQGVLNPGVLLPPPSPDEPPLPRFRRAVEDAVSGRPLESDPAVGGEASWEVDAGNLTVEAGGATRCEEVAKAVRSAGFTCPALDHDGSVAELVSERGHRDPLRSLLLAVEADLVDGPGARFGSAAMKDVAGLDAKRLLAGSHGAFGRVRSAILRVLPA